DPGQETMSKRENSELREAVVLGTELAEAARREEEWKKRPRAMESLLPEGGYDFWRGETNLVSPAPTSLDGELRAVCETYAAATVEEREKLRDSISMQGFGTLMTFAQRCAIFAIREKKTEFVVSGLRALAMIEEQRVDFRDIYLCMPLLYHAASKLGAD